MEAQMASVTILPVTRPVREVENTVAIPGAVPGAVPGRQAERAGVVHPAVQRTRPVRRRPPHLRPGGPRPVACERSYQPGLHGSRLTQRGRVVVGLIWVLLAVAVISMVSRPAEVPVPVETTTVVVRAGDTLWSLADGLAPDADRRVTISQIVELNGLGSAGDIHPGDVLVVPAG
jgi:nucleoid-associated protein YgaU